jgi:hypothetical protein
LQEQLVQQQQVHARRKVQPLSVNYWNILPYLQSLKPSEFFKPAPHIWAGKEG